MRVLVTGATGFVGRHTLEPLVAAGHDVHAVARSELSVDGVEWHRADLLEPGPRRRVLGRARADALLHLAWYVEHGRFWTSPANLDWVAASLEMVREFADAGGSRVVAVGTCAEYDWRNLGTGICHEARTPCDPGTPYGVAKLALYRLLCSFAEELGIDFAWGRLFFLLGPAEPPDRLVPYLVRELSAGRPARLSSGRQERDFMDSRDAGAALAELLVRPVEGAVNIGTGTPTTIADLAEAVARQMGRVELLELGGRPDRPDEPERLVADVSRLRLEVGFEPERSLEQGLADAIDWWRRR